MTTCVQCRQRKVRCRGGPDGCDACSRLGFQCSLSGISPTSPTSPRSGDRDPNSIVPRKRVGRACDACHARRSRCSGDAPSCLRCRQQGIPCHYSLSVRQYRAEERRRRHADAVVEGSLEQEWSSGTDNIDNSTPMTTSEAVVSPIGSSHDKLDELLGCDKAIVRQHIDAYFEYIYPIPLFSFLHRADFLRQYSSGTLCPDLLLAVCGASSRFVPSYKERCERAKSWIDRAETMLFQSLGKVDIAQVQTMMILGLQRNGNHQTGKTFHFLSLAVRTAYLLKLHKEDTRLPFVTQECRRRLLWCIFTVDRFCAGGVPEYILLPVSSISIQLPCRERYFEFDTSVETEHLRDAARSPDTELSLSACILRVLDVRNRVLQYTKSLLETSTSPEQSLPQFQAFEKELQDIYNSLPNEFLFSPRAFQVRAYSPSRTSFIALHIYWHHCHCELYRVLNPGYRETLPTSVIYSTSPDFVSYAQSNCLQHAVSVGEIISSTHKLTEGPVYVSDSALFVCLYQASCAILYACHRDSPSYSLDPSSARGYFQAFIEALSRSMKYYPRFNIYVEDIKNMLRSIDNPNTPLPVQKHPNEVDFRARPILQEDSSEGETLHDATMPTTALDTHQGSSQICPQQGSLNVTATLPQTDMADSLLQTQQSLSMSMEGQDLLWPYLGAMEYGPGFGTDPSQNLLWDWADALSSNFT